MEGTGRPWEQVASTCLCRQAAGKVTLADEMGCSAILVIEPGSIAMYKWVVFCEVQGHSNLALGMDC